MIDSETSGAFVVANPFVDAHSLAMWRRWVQTPALAA